MNFAEFLDWVVGHRRRHPDARFPDPADATSQTYYESRFRAILALGNINAAVLTEASERLVSEPPKRASDHFETLRAYCVDAMRKTGADSGAADSRETAEAASRDCRWCGGSGLTTVWNREPDPEEKKPESVGAYCSCRLGRWVRRAHAKGCPDVLKRTPDLVSVLAGNGFDVFENPAAAAWERAHFVRHVLPMAIVKALVASHKLERSAGFPVVAPPARAVRALPGPAPAHVRESDRILTREHVTTAPARSDMAAVALALRSIAAGDGPEAEAARGVLAAMKGANNNADASL